MIPEHADDLVTFWAGDCVEVMANALPDASVDAVVTDPPYGLGFMGQEWDWAIRPSTVLNDSPYARARVEHAGPSYGGEPLAVARAYQAWCELWAAECLRVVKPGGHMLAFGGTRTYHRMVAGIEDAGWEIRDSLHWIYGQGFPKSLDVAKAIDAAAGVVRGRAGAPISANSAMSGGNYERTPKGPPVTDAAKQWQGWGTALKPAHEPIVLCRKPLAHGSVAANVGEHGTGALNLAACQVPGGVRVNPPAANKPGTVYNMDAMGSRHDEAEPTVTEGRWPPNVLLDGAAAAELDRQSGQSRSPSRPVRQGGRRGFGVGTAEGPRREGYGEGYGDAGGASRFFPVFEDESEPPAPRRGRGGIWQPSEDGIPAGPTYSDAGGASRFFPVFRYDAKADNYDRMRLPDGTMHPTVKPVSLMRWLVRLVTPPGGVALDCFAGSGTTAEACVAESRRCILIEKDERYAKLILKRLGRPVQQDLFGGEL